MSLRLFVDAPLSAGLELSLPEAAARHVQVRRLQPGDTLRLFDGRGGEWEASVRRMGKRDVDVEVGAHRASEREWPFHLEIALGMPTNERMDALVEKATELGVRRIQPLHCERSVLRLEGERAQRRVEHWRAVAASAAEQCGRTRVPEIASVRTLAQWLAAGTSSADVADVPVRRLVLSTSEAPSLAACVPAASDVRAAPARWLALSGPEGGFSADEENAARAAGFEPVSLGPMILRADTAPLAWLAQMAVLLR